MSNILPMFYSNVGRCSFLNSVFGGLCEKTYTNVRPSCIYPMRPFSKDAYLEGEKKTPKIVTSPKITLLGHKNSVIITMDSAELMAKRRNMALVRVLDADRLNDRPIYK